MVKILDETKDFLIVKIPASMKKTLRFFAGEEKVTPAEKKRFDKILATPREKRNFFSLAEVERMYGI